MSEKENDKINDIGFNEFGPEFMHIWEEITNLPEELFSSRDDKKFESVEAMLKQKKQKSPMKLIPNGHLNYSRDPLLDDKTINNSWEESNENGGVTRCARIEGKTYKAHYPPIYTFKTPVPDPVNGINWHTLIAHSESGLAARSCDELLKKVEEWKKAAAAAQKLKRKQIEGMEENQKLKNQKKKKIIDYEQRL